MAGKVGRALGFTSDFAEGSNPGRADDKRAKQGLNESDVSRIVEGKGPDPVGGDDDSMGPESGSPDSGSMTADEPKGPMGPEEIAMKMFSRAKSPAEQAAALRAFGEACGWGGGQGDLY